MNTTTTLPIWRSMLFVPAHVEKFVVGAASRGADGYILDLEDSVPVAQKPAARAGLRNAASRIASSGAAVLVRVNSPSQGQAFDLAAAVGDAVRAIVLPKVNAASDIHAVVHLLERLELERNLPVGHTRLIAQIEDVRALPHLDEIATASDRLMAMILGTEDFSASAGMEPTPQALFAPNQQVLFACRRAGLLPFGFPASIAEFEDVEAFRQQIRFARRLGFVGAFCIHPSQIVPMNEEFSPSADEVAHARGLIEAFEAGERAGQGAVEYLGKMVDLPVANRARELLRRALQTYSQEIS